MNNPLWHHHQIPLAFNELKTDHVRQAAERVMLEADEIKSRIVSSDVCDMNSRLLLRDDLFNRINLVLDPLYLLKETHPDADLRQACHEAVETLSNFWNALLLDESLFASLEGFSRQEQPLTPLQQRFLRKETDYYQRNGFRLSQAERGQLKSLDEQLNRLELQFQKNLAEAEVTLCFEEKDLDGLPEDFKQAHRQEDGSYKVTTQYPDYFPMMKYAHNEDVRRQLFLVYNNRAKTTNLPLLDRILKLRIKRATLLGYDSFADYNLGNVMAKKPENVWRFIGELSEKVAEKAKHDYQKLCRFAQTPSLPSWDKLYVTNRYKKQFFELDDQEIKTYFPLDRALKGLFELTQELYGIDFHEDPQLPTWHEDVRAFQVLEDGVLIGRFYLDFFPRPNKYTHAACFGLQAGKNLPEGYQLPVSALVCNFTRPSQTQPCLLTHGDVETLFHEFGHLMHQLLTTSPLFAFAGTSVERDFVEMPSQIMEHWVWQKEALKRFAAHYQSGQVISDDLIDKMLAVKHLNSGLDIQQQLLYASIDMTYHGGFTPKTERDTTDILHRLWAQYTLFPVVRESHFQACFGHLVGYAAAYYGYLWSRVYADDMFSVFKQNGLYDPRCGRRFREIVLASGDTRDPMDLITEFLQREPRMDAFLQGIGVQTAV